MFVTRPHDDLDGILAGLPAGFRWVASGDERLVAGPTGVFLVARPGPEGVGPTANRLARSAADTRAALARTLAWVPFVDVLVVADDDTSPAAATVVPVGMLRRVLTEGQGVLDAATVEQVREVAEVLSAYRVAGGALAARMGLCTTPPGGSRPLTGSPSPSTTWAATGAPSCWPTPPASTAGSGRRSPST